MIKTFKSQKPYFTNNWSDYSPLGHDCMYRSITVEQNTNIKKEFGMILINKKNNKDYGPNGNPQRFLSYRNYYSPYRWHVWNENEDTIFDYPEAIFEHSGATTSNVQNVLVIEAPKHINHPKTLDLYLKTTVKNLMFKGSYDLIYIKGVALQNFHNEIMDQDYFNEVVEVTIEELQETCQ